MTRTQPAPPILGYFGLSSDWRLEGWCWSAADPAARQQVEVTLNGRVVHVCVAVQFNELLRQSGRGDGRCGFSLSPPAQIGAAGAGEMIMEARECRSKTVLGRVVFHGEEAYLPQMRRLNDVDRQLHRHNADMTAWSSPLLEAVGDALIRFGRDLSLGNGIKSRNNRHGAVLHQARAAMSRFVPIVSHVSCNPELSLVFVGSDWRSIYAALRHTAAVTPSISKEFIVIDDELHPMMPLLTTLANGLQILRRLGLQPAGCFNKAVRLAKGRVLCIVESPATFSAVAIAGLLQQDQAMIGGSALETLSRPIFSGDAKARPYVHVPPGVLLLMTRDDYGRAGGLEGSGRHGVIDWDGFGGKLKALRVDVVAGASRTDVGRALAGLAHESLSA